MITIILNLINKAMEGILISELKEKKIIDGSEVIPVENKNKNYNINIYAIHDEGSGEDSYYKHVYDNLIVEYIKGEHTQYLSKPLGCGSNLHMDIIIKNCIFKNGKENVSDVSWHFVDNANCKFTITGNRFNYKFSFDNATVVQFNNVKE